MKEEKTECLFLHVTPSFKKEYESIQDDDKMKEFVIKQYFQREVGWMEEDLKEMDNSTIKYKAQLIKIKEAFGKANEDYSDEISKMYDCVSIANRKLSEELVKQKTEVDNLAKSVRSLNEQVNEICSSIDTYKMQRLNDMLNMAERFAKLSDDEKGFIKLVINKGE